MNFSSHQSQAHAFDILLGSWKVGRLLSIGRQRFLRAREHLDRVSKLSSRQLASGRLSGSTTAILWISDRSSGHLQRELTPFFR